MALLLELYPLIFLLLYDDKDSVALARCSLVCRFFSIECQSLLFRRIILTIDDTAAAHSRATALKNTFLDRPALGNLVKDLQITLGEEGYLALAPTLWLAFFRISHLNSFALDCISFFSWYSGDINHRGFIQAIEHLICLPTVTRLRLSRVLCPIGLFFQRNPNLKSISFDNVRHYYDRDWDLVTHPIQHELEEYSSNVVEAGMLTHGEARHLLQVDGTPRIIIDWAKLRVLDVDFVLWTQRVIGERGYTIDADAMVHDGLSSFLPRVPNISELSLLNVADGGSIESCFRTLPLPTRLNLTRLDVSFKLKDQRLLELQALAGQPEGVDVFTKFFDLLPGAFPPGNSLRDMRIEALVVLSAIPSKDWADAFIEAVTPSFFPRLRSLEVVLSVLDVDGQRPNEERMVDFVQAVRVVRDAFNATGMRIWFNSTFKYVHSFS